MRMGFVVVCNHNGGCYFLSYKIIVMVCQCKNNPVGRLAIQTLMQPRSSKHTESQLSLHDGGSSK